MDQNQLAEILNRISVLEIASAPPIEADISDPPLYLTDATGAPVNPDSIEKIPDLVKDLPIFTGDPSELNVWLRDAEGLVKLYQPSLNSPVDKRNKFHVVCKTIRRKIRGEANDALVASNVNMNWNLIKRTLVTYYGEKRDLGTLDYQLSNSCQKGRSMEEFYNEINKILSLISNCVATDDQFAHPEAAKSILSLYNRKAVDAFIRGLDGEVGKFLKNANVDSLPTAYAYCITFQNMEFRKSLARPKIYEETFGPRNQIPQPPKLPPKPLHISRIPISQMQPRMQHPQFMPKYIPPQYPHRYTLPPAVPPRNVPFNNYPHYIPQFPQRNHFQKPMDKPVPMEVDPSIRSRQVNYGNRPAGPPLKRPRQFNISTQEQLPEQSEEYHEVSESQVDNYFQLPYVEDENESSFERYIKAIETQETPCNEEEEEFAELNFLD